MPAPPKNPKEVHQLLDKCKPPDKRKPPGCGSVHSNVPRLSYRAPVARGFSHRPSAFQAGGGRPQSRRGRLTVETKVATYEEDSQGCHPPIFSSNNM